MKTGAMIIFSLMAVSFHAKAQEADKTIQKGNDFYKQNEFDKAESMYSEVLQSGTNTTAEFNQANAMYRQGKITEAGKSLDKVIMNTDKADLKSKAYYNEGVMLTSQKRLEESIEAYKNSLRQNPNDQEARENLQKALLELKKRTPPPPKKDNKKNQQKQKQQQQPKMNEKEAEQRLQLLDQKEKEIQQRMQSAKTGGAMQKDW